MKNKCSQLLSLKNSTALQGCRHTDLLINIYHFVCTCHTFVPWKNPKNIVMGVLILIRLETHRAYTLRYWSEAQWPIRFQSDSKNITVKRSIHVKIHCLALLWYSLQNYCINTYGWVTFHCYISQLLVILLLSVFKGAFCSFSEHFNQKYINRLF